MSAPMALRYAERELRVWTRLWRGTVFSSVLSPILFLGAMGVGLGGLIDDNAGRVDGLEYLVFVTPGLLAGAAMQNASGLALWNVMGGHKWAGHFRGAVASPLRPADVYTGYLIWLGSYIGMCSIPFLAVAALLGGVPSPWAVLAVPAAALCALAFAAPLAAYAMSQDSEFNFAAVQRLVIMPLFLFSGTFFPLDQLPSGLRSIAWVTPLWHGVELCRGATTGSLGLSWALLHVAVLVAFIAVGATLGIRAANRRLAS
jgi:lipooligosaccharide transport system permease protein